MIVATRHIEGLSQEHAHKQTELNHQLEEAKQKSEEMLKTAQEEARRTKMKVIQDAEAERDRILQQAHTQSEELIAAGGQVKADLSSMKSMSVSLKKR